MLRSGFFWLDHAYLQSLSTPRACLSVMLLILQLCRFFTEVVRIEILNTNVRRCQSTEHPHFAEQAVRDQRVGSVIGCFLLDHMLVYENDKLNPETVEVLCIYHSATRPPRGVNLLCLPHDYLPVTTLELDLCKIEIWVLSNTIALRLRQIATHFLSTELRGPVGQDSCRSHCWRDHPT